MEHRVSILLIVVSVIILIVSLYILHSTIPPNIEDSKYEILNLLDVRNLKYCDIYGVKNYIYYRDLDLLLAPYPNIPTDICKNNRDYEGCLLLTSPTDNYPISKPIARRGNQLYYGYLSGNPGCRY